MIDIEKRKKELQEIIDNLQEALDDGDMMAIAVVTNNPGDCTTHYYSCNQSFLGYAAARLQALYTKEFLECS